MNFAGRYMSKMKYHSMSEQWSFDDGRKFLYTTVILHDGSDYYAADTDQRVMGEPESLDMTLLQPKKIPVEHISPPWEEGLTVFPDPGRDDIYTKTPYLACYTGCPMLANFVLQEARVCEKMLDHPHPNVAKYLGCVIKDGRITGLCFERFFETVADQIERGLKVDKPRCLLHVRQGIEHLHSLGLVHNDLRTANIMFTNSDGGRFAIIDFDSCVRRGGALPIKQGHMPPDAKSSEFENDEFAFQELMKALDAAESNCDDDNDDDDEDDEDDE